MTNTTCAWCGQEERLEIFEVWEDGQFQLDSCCQEFHDEICATTDQDEWAGLLRAMDFEALTGRRLRRVVPGLESLYADYRLAIRPVSFREAREFVAHHHAHCSAPVGWKFGASIWNGMRQIGVAMVGRPVARMLDPRTTVEVNRLCIRRDLPEGLQWNAASQLLGWAAREAAELGYRKIVTYTLESERGTSLVAAGWNREVVTKGGSWHRASRARTDRSPTGRKVRWGRVLQPRGRGAAMVKAVAVT